MKKKPLSDMEIIEVAKALSEPNRLAIYTQISQRDEMFCQEMVTQNGITHSTLSHHLKVLSEAGLVKARKEGLNKYYRAVPAKFEAFVCYMNEIAHSFVQPH